MTCFAYTTGLLHSNFSGQKGRNQFALGFIPTQSRVIYISIIYAITYGGVNLLKQFARGMTHLHSYTCQAQLVTQLMDSLFIKTLLKYLLHKFWFYFTL